MLWMLWFLLYQEIKKAILKMASFLLNVRIECLYLNWLLHELSCCCFEHFVSSMRDHGPHCGSWQKRECWSSWFYCCVGLSCVNSRVKLSFPSSPGHPAPPTWMRTVTRWPSVTLCRGWIMRWTAFPRAASTVACLPWETPTNMTRRWNTSTRGDFRSHTARRRALGVTLPT